MTYKARFVHGSRYFNLDAGEFSLFQDFIFPAADEALNISTPNVGSMSGGQVISKTAQDRWWAWSVMITGTSNAQTHLAARRLAAWLSQSIEDKTDEVYFEYTPNYVVPAPIWGQHGAPYRFNVKAAIVDMDGSYYVADIPNKALVLPISLLVGPYALGARQRLAHAMGGVIEDTIGTLDGMPRGTIVASNTTNKMTNPIFGNGLTDWNAGASLRAAVNTDMSYVLWGSQSALVSRMWEASTRVLYQTITAGNTNPHYLQAYVKKRDGSAITSSDLSLFYGVEISTTYTALGDGWYMLSAPVTGIAGATITGVSILKYDTPYYIAGVQLEEGENPTPMTHGDMLGCAWTGAAHASTSTRTAGYIRIPTAGLFSVPGGSICVAVKHAQRYDRTVSGHLFNDGTMVASYNQTNDDYRFTEGTATAEGEAQTFIAGDIQVLHFVWGPSILNIYLNGAIYATSASLTPWTVGEYLYIGSSATAASHFNGTILDFTIWDTPLTTAQVAADYADVSAHVRGGDGFGQRLSSIPYLWTKDGDNQVDNCTDATHNHFAIAAGIQGSTEAETEINGAAGTAFSGLHLSNFASQRYINPSVFFADNSGSADAAAVGGQAYVSLVSTLNNSLSSQSVNWYPYQYPEFSEMQFYVLVRMKTATAGYMRIQPYVYSNAYSVNTSIDLSPVYSVQTGYGLFRTNAGITEKNYSGFDTAIEAVSVYGYRNAGTVSTSLDYAVMFPRPYLFCNGYAITRFSLFDKTIVKVTGGAIPGLVEEFDAVGDTIEFSPNKYNALQTLMGRAGDDPALSFTLTYDIYITPRYNLL
jgi:hypothetical protein